MYGPPHYDINPPSVYADECPCGDNEPCHLHPDEYDDPGRFVHESDVS